MKFLPGGSSFVSSPDGKECYMLYHARQIPNDAPGAMDSRTPRLQKIEWDKDRMPILGIPLKKENPWQSHLVLQSIRLITFLYFQVQGMNVLILHVDDYFFE